MTTPRRFTTFDPALVQRAVERSGLPEESLEIASARLGHLMTPQRFLELVADGWIVPDAVTALSK